MPLDLPDLALQSRCISYDLNPLKRCGLPSEGKFCTVHRTRLSRAPHYKTLDRGIHPVETPLEERSSSSLMKLHAKIDAAVKARQAFTEIMICCELRDEGHLQRIEVLLGVQEEVEAILAARAESSLPSEDEPPLGNESPPHSQGTPPLRVMVKSGKTRKKLDAWKKVYQEMLEDNKKTFEEGEALALRIIARYNYPIEVVYLLGWLRSKLGGTFETFLKSPVEFSSQKKWAPPVDIYEVPTSIASASPFERLRMLWMGVSELDLIPQDLIVRSNAVEGIATTLKMASEILEWGLVFVCYAGELSALIWPVGGPKVYVLKARSDPFHRVISVGYPRVPEPLPAPGTTFKEFAFFAAEEIPRGISLKMMSYLAAPRIAKLASVLCGLKMDPLKAMSRLAEEVSLFKALQMSSKAALALHEAGPKVDVGPDGITIN